MTVTFSNVHMAESVWPDQNSRYQADLGHVLKAVLAVCRNSPELQAV
jgi:hypothetical protein